jgi:hypothetical protein
VVQVANKLARRLASLPSQAAFTLWNLPFLEDYVLGPSYEKSLREHRPRLPKLDETQAQILDDIRSRGVALTSIGELAIPESEELMTAARAISEDLHRLSRRPENAGKHTVQATSAHLMERPVIFRWGLAARILEVVECYLGLPVGYDGLSYYYSLADGRETGPRLWHRDHEDRRMLKVALYVHDVDDQGGPFLSMLPECSKRVGDPQRYKSRPLTEEQILGRLPGDRRIEAVNCTGPAGTIIFADTCQYYHRGKPPVRADRSAIFFSYFARPPRHPFLCHRSPLSPGQIRSLVADLTPNQRAAALWDREVPFAVNWIPKNFIKV